MTLSRASLLVFHRRLALIFAPLLLLQALTGGALLFHQPLAQAIDPAGMIRQTSAGEAPLSALISAAEARMGGFQAERVFYPATPTDTVFVQLAGPHGQKRYVSLDPGSAEALAAGTIWRFPMEAAIQLHYRLLGQTGGLGVIVLNGLALIALASLGLAYWWPGAGLVRRSLAIKRSAPARVRLRQWHRNLGVFLSALCLFSAGSGLLLVVPDFVAAASAPVAAAAATTPPARPALPRYDLALAQGRAALPSARVRDIRLRPDQTIAINFFAPENGPRAVHVVAVDLAEPTVQQLTMAQDNPVLWMKVLPFHSGDSFGLTGRSLLLLEAGVLGFLAISGPMMWWRARRRARPAKVVT